ncbi:MAG TPA: hypothetical protein VM689_14700 [Aliidongia sp.]|nr:hypothetical protein [Aliidongia sp.]
MDGTAQSRKLQAKLSQIQERSAPARRLAQAAVGADMRTGSATALVRALRAANPAEIAAARHRARLVGIGPDEITQIERSTAQSLRSDWISRRPDQA